MYKKLSNLHKFLQHHRSPETEKIELKKFLFQKLRNIFLILDVDLQFTKKMHHFSEKTKSNFTVISNSDR